MLDEGRLREEGADDSPPLRICRRCAKPDCVVFQSVPVNQRYESFGSFDASAYLVFAKAIRLRKNRFEAMARGLFKLGLLAGMDANVGKFQDHRSSFLRWASRCGPEQANQQIGTILDSIRATGFESIPSVQVRGLYAISFSILDTQGQAIAALTVPYAERIDQVQRKSIPEVTQALGIAARTLSARIGGMVSSAGLNATEKESILKRTKRPGEH